MKTGFRIFFGERSFHIVSETGNNNTSLDNDKSNLVLRKPTKEAIGNAIASLESKAIDNVWLLAENTNEAMDLFSSFFTTIQAGGGLVENDKGEFLFIFRRGKWDLPKGKLEEDENISACALREVEEETGLSNITLLHHLCNTYHVYHEEGIFILKESVWYKMRSSSGQVLTPQTEEDILDIKWLKPAEWKSVYDHTFPSIKEVLAASGKLNMQ